jgi:hypothetical protein
MRYNVLRWVSALLLLTNSQVTAQVIYSVDFEGATETKTVYASGTVTLSSLDWDMTEALIGTAAADYKNGARSARLRGYAASSMSMLEDLPNVGQISFLYRRYGTDVQVDWRVEYSIDQGVSWIQIGSDFIAPSTNDVQTFSENLDISVPVRFRVKRATESGASNNRLNIDDITFTQFGCNTESFTSETACLSYDFFGNELTESGDYQEVLSGANAAGCDSTVNLSLTIVSGFTYYADLDMDGFGDPNVTIEACSVPVGYVENANDCNDSDNQIGAASEVYYADADGDGFGVGDPILFCSDPGVGYSTNNDDCNDNDNTVYPGAVEIFDDGIDQDCDGQDASAFGSQIAIYEFLGTVDCNTQDVEANVGAFNVSFSDYTSENTSCANAGGVFNRNNWNTSAEIDLTQYNEFSLTTDDCYELTLTKLSLDHRVSNVTSVPTWYVRSSLDGFASDLASGNSGTTVANAEVILGPEFQNLTNVTFRFYLTSVTANTTAWRNDNVSVFGFENTLTPSTYYADTDGDGYGDLNNTILACNLPSGYVTNSDDCDDEDVVLNPETIWYLDEDGDGYGDESSATVSCDQPSASHVLESDDCDDNDNTVYPGAPELCDSKDNDCNGFVDDQLTFTEYFVDADGDGFGAGDAVEFCENPGDGYVTNNDDCDDTDETITTAVLYYEDADGDGYGNDDETVWSCEDLSGEGYVLDGGDCDDTDEFVYPGATEICDGKDNDCNGDVDDGLTFTTYYVDADGDGFGAGEGIEFCENPGAGYSLVNDDCDDSNETIYPGAAEIADDDIDQDCDGEDLSTASIAKMDTVKFELVPNPSNGNVKVRFNQVVQDAEITIFALTGQQVSSLKVSGNMTNLNLTHLNDGVYLVRIRTERGEHTSRLILTK